MGKKRKSKPFVRGKSPPTPTEPRGGSWPALAAVLALAAILRCWHLAAPLGGFHAFNEANYLLIARHFFQTSLIAPTPDGSYVFLETPPLYTYLLYLVFAVFGVSVLAARLVSVVSSLALVAATFLLGRKLLGPRPALAGALLVAISPVAVLTGRNIQTDSTMLLFLVMGLLFWRRAESENDRDWPISGVFLGLALFTKLFALIGVLGVVVWDTVDQRGLAWLRDRRRWIAALIAAALPLLFYGYHAVKDIHHLRRDILGGAAVATTFPTSAGQWSALGLESLWAFSPFIALLILAGIARAATKPNTARLFLLTQFLVFLFFYLFVHKHSYYLLTLLPFGALLAGDFLEGLTAKARLVGLSVAVVTGVFVSTIDVTSMKLGFREFAELSSIAPSLPDDHTYLVDQAIRDNAGTVVAFYDPSGHVAGIERVPEDSDGRLLLPDHGYLLRYVSPKASRPPEGWLLSRERFGLTLFGWTLAEAHPNPNFFRQGGYVALHTGGLSDFGANPLRTYPALALLPLPPDVPLYRTSEGLAIRPR